jgi:Short C-terminal domain
MELLWVVVIGTSIWVGIDASSLGVRRGSLGGGPFDMGVAAWFLVCLLLWIVGFPSYLATRSRYVECKRRAVSTGTGLNPPRPFTAFPPAQPHPAPSSQWPLPSPAQQAWADKGWAPDGSTPPAMGSLVDELARLAALRDSGALTQAEFETLKARRLDPRES